ncbi:MAG: CHAT domain-containing protein [Bryobacterales bacterium]|nr:CHAT domain-containing protein [Bryobacterales bacterium]
MSTRALQEHEAGRTAEAILLAREGRAHASGEEEAARLRLVEAEALLVERKPAEAARLLAEGVPAGLEPWRLYLDGDRLRRERQTAQALEVLRRAAALAAKVRDARSESMAWLFIGRTQSEAGDLKAAAESAREAARIAQAAGLGYPESLARTNLGYALLQGDRPENAVSDLLRAADLARRRGDAVTEARATNNLANCYLRLGDPERALPHNDRAVHGFHRPDLLADRIAAIGTRGQILGRLGRRDEAIEQGRLAVNLARQQGDRNVLRRWANNLTPALLAAGQLDEAAALIDEVQAIHAGRKLPEALLAYAWANRAELAELRGQAPDARRDWTAILALADSSPSLRWEAEFGLARLDDAAGQRRLAQAGYEKALAGATVAWASLREQDSKLTFLNRAASVYRQYAAALIRWGDEAGALRVEESRRARLLTQGSGGAPASAPRVDRENLRRLAAESGVTMLAYWIAPARSYVRVIAPDGTADRIDLPGAAEPLLAALVDRHAARIEIDLANPLADPDPQSAGRRLYDLLIEPVRTKIGPARRVAIVPDGPLHRINFETLVRERGGRPGFWIEDAEIQIAPSLGLLLASGETAATAPRRLLLVGDAEASVDYPRLDHAAAEMRHVQADFVAAGADVTAWAGPQALRSRFLAADLGSYSHIHFSAHAEARWESPLDSAVILSPEPGGYRLTAREVSALPLAAQLVTVSACRSAGGRVLQGEGVVGFAWAFQRAGVGSVVAGLWDIGDRAASQLMKPFYAALAAGRPVTAALREAKLAVIAAGPTGAKPYNWAGYQVFSHRLHLPRKK